MLEIICYFNKFESEFVQLKFNVTKRFIGNFFVKSGPVSDGVQTAVSTHNLPTNYAGFTLFLFQIYSRKKTNQLKTRRHAELVVLHR